MALPVISSLWGFPLLKKIAFLFFRVAHTQFFLNSGDIKICCYAVTRLFLSLGGAVIPVTWEAEMGARLGKTK
jgi:hypothetical protein